MNEALSSSVGSGVNLEVSEFQAKAGCVFHWQAWPGDRFLGVPIRSVPGLGMQCYQGGPLHPLLQVLNLRDVA